MKVQVYIKDPDGFYESVRQAVEDEVATLNLDEYEVADIVASRMVKVWDAMSPWIEYQECVTLEFDTEAGTATILRK